MPQLLDFNPHVIASAAFAQKEFGENATDDMIRHAFYTGILMFNKQFRQDYGEMIICCDGQDNWRKKHFPYYKHKRKKARADSPLDWDQIHRCMAEIAAEMDEFFPYKVIGVDEAEGDDVIAVLSKYFSQHELESKSGLYRKPQSVLIISEDKDFKQLQVLGNVVQYAPRQKRFLQELNPDLFLKEQVIRGDSTDGVPNFKMPDDFFVVGEGRQSPIRATHVEEWVLHDDPSEFCEDEEQLENWKRNNKMINLLEGIPKEVESNIIEQYHTVRCGDKGQILNYCVSHGLKNIIQDIQDF